MHQRLLQSAPQALGPRLEKPLGLRTKGRINEHRDRNQTGTGPAWRSPIREGGHSARRTFSSIFCSQRPRGSSTSVPPDKYDRRRNAHLFCKKTFSIRGIQDIHQIGEVNRSGEYRPREKTSGSASAKAGEQPNPHNPLKERKNLASARSGETFLKGKWQKNSATKNLKYLIFIKIC